MCTALSLGGKRHWFGRTLDLECSYGEEIVLMQRRRALCFRRHATLRDHPAILGVAHVSEGIPLYYDAVNEHGLAMAALRFPHYAVYGEAGAESVASFELIPYLLGQCRSLAEARRLLLWLTVDGDSFSDALPASPLHWMLADRTGAIVIEPTEDGLRIHDAREGVLTNAPPYPMQSVNPALFVGGGAPTADAYSRGLEAFGLPGDFSSPSRFARMAYIRQRWEGEPSPSSVFHMLDGVSQPLGCTRTEDGRAICTQYASVYDTEEGICYLTTYACRRIRAVSMRMHQIGGDGLLRFPSEAEEDILML